MIYIFDTNVFIVLNHFYPATFRSLWEGLEKLVAQGEIISTREVLKELAAQNDKDYIQEWVERHKSVFSIPDEQEMLFVQKILAVPYFQALINRKALLRGTPVADPFVIAAAKIKNGTVVTQEQAKPHAAKIPNVCDHFKIPCIDLEEFMKRQGWSF